MSLLPRQNIYHREAKGIIPSTRLKGNHDRLKGNHDDRFLHDLWRPERKRKTEVQHLRRTRPRPYPQETVAYENLVKWSYVQQAGNRLEGAVQADITGYFPIPSSTPKKKKQAMANETVEYTHKVDCDNLAKIILDSLNEIAYKDDAQVSRLTVRKLYSEKPRVEVTLTEIYSQ